MSKWYRDGSNNNENQNRGQKLMKIDHKTLADAVDKAVPLKLTSEVQELIAGTGSIEQLDYLAERITNADEDVRAAIQAHREALEDQDADSFVEDFIGNQGGAR